MRAQLVEFRTWAVEYQLDEESISMRGIRLTREELSEFRQLLLDIRESGDRLAEQLAKVREEIKEET